MNRFNRGATAAVIAGSGTFFITDAMASMDLVSPEAAAQSVESCASSLPEEPIYLTPSEASNRFPDDCNLIYNSNTVKTVDAYDSDGQLVGDIDVYKIPTSAEYRSQNSPSNLEEEQKRLNKLGQILQLGGTAVMTAMIFGMVSTKKFIYRGRYINQPGQPLVK